MTMPVNEPPMPVMFSAYLDELTAGARSRSVPWEEYHRASLISDEELATIMEFERTPKDAKVKLLELFFGLLGRIVRVDTLQSTLLVLDSLLTDDVAVAQICLSMSENGPTTPFSAFTKLLAKDDELIRLLSSKLLACLAVACGSSLPPGVDFEPYLAYLATQLQSNNSNHVDLAVQNLQSILSVIETRIQFFNISAGKGVQSLVELLRKQNPSPQMQYQVTFCLWLLSFNEEAASTIQKKFDIIQPLLDTARSANKEKVIRVVVAVYRNLLEKAREVNAPPMIGNKALPFLETCSQRKFADSEIANDLEYLKTELREILQRLSSFDEYSSEVRSTRLEWSPAHTSELFWKANAIKLNEKDYELLRILSRILVTSSDPLILSVAAHDVGQYVKYHAAGKKFLQEIGTKQRIMELMNHDDGDVRYQALIAVQKYMVQNW